MRCAGWRDALRFPALLRCAWECRLGRSSGQSPHATQSVGICAHAGASERGGWPATLAYAEYQAGEGSGDQRTKGANIPTIVLLLGWRLFFYANEGDEPMHVHAKKADMECKFWLDIDTFDISSVYAYNMSPRATREIRKIIFSHFDYIVDQWEAFQARRRT